jgi:hypothetical protein
VWVKLRVGHLTRDLTSISSVDVDRLMNLVFRGVVLCDGVDRSRRFELTRLRIVTSCQTTTLNISAEISHVGQSAASGQELDALSS